ncbi:FbpB family small basic protein [Bacillus thuringiensis]
MVIFSSVFGQVQLLIENKQSLLNNKENMKEIEERIEKRHVAYSGASN